jgi:SAM-dependent methyltransferase
MSHPYSLNRCVFDSLPNDFTNKIVLDIGCGYGDWGFLIRTRKKGIPELIGLEIWQPYIIKIRQMSIYDHLIKLKLPFIPFKDKTIDISVGCEIIEHLQKDAGLKLLTELERVTRQLIVVSVPINLPSGWIASLDNNPYQMHCSNWTPKDFMDRGFGIKYASLLPGALGVINDLRRLIFRIPHTDTSSRHIVAYKHPLNRKGTIRT